MAAEQPQESYMAETPRASIENPASTEVPSDARTDGIATPSVAVYNAPDTAKKEKVDQVLQSDASVPPNARKGQRLTA